MGTLLKSASVGTAIHEWMHTWYQMLMGSNESLYPWMDEGFTSYISNLAMNEILPPKEPESPFADSYNNYVFLANSGNLEAVKIPNSKGMPRMSPIVKKTSNGSR